jgi:predicted nucleotidyltransferase component of viral defense system
MESTKYPTSIEEISGWRLTTGAPLEIARRRFIQFVVLTAISSSPALAQRIAFKGGNALSFVHGNPRSTVDLDFSAEGDFPDDSGEIRALVDHALKSAQNQFRVKARCQSIHRDPAKLDKTLPTYRLKICFQLPGDRYFQNFEEKAGFSEVVELEISINDIVCETIPWMPSASGKAIRSCSLEDQIAEKLRALLQQVPRNRTRPQDVFDIASRVRQHRRKLDLEKISSFLVRKSEGRIDPPRKSAFNDEIRRRAEVEYDRQIIVQTSEYIHFEEAWTEVLELVHKLSIPE